MKSIGQLAKELKMNVETIRFYEKQGLITQPIKPDVGYRMYDEAIANKLIFIAKAKTLGFSLKEIASLLLMDNNCTQLEDLHLEKLTIIREKITHLQLLEKAINDMDHVCKSNNQSNSYLINALK
ncbi:MerR family transcriptional regulator [Pseudocolwellia agarivorans]|uniref:MerR family transcriptional regulator n=1 Tax=Pseudocolwellia agarivorans TaxID=1911682 RepID=UPI0009869658|nr:MerR family transcriptional regulator [Pseudocolwellia agarivorans]